MKTYIHHSRSWTKSVVIANGNILSYMFEEIIRNVFGMIVLNANIHVNTCLDIIWWNVSFFKIMNCSSHRVGNGFISRWEPWSLDLGYLFSVSSLFLKLSGHISDWFDCRLGLWNGIEITCEIVRGIIVHIAIITLLEVINLRYSSSSSLLINFSFILTFIVSKLFDSGMLN